MAGVGTSRHLGASCLVVSGIHHGVRVKFKNGLRPKAFNHGISVNNATQSQLDFFATELKRFEAIPLPSAYEQCNYLSP
jgi:hypothetical protein